MGDKLDSLSCNVHRNFGEGEKVRKEVREERDTLSDNHSKQNY